MHYPKGNRDMQWKSRKYFVIKVKGTIWCLHLLENTSVCITIFSPSDSPNNYMLCSQPRNRFLQPLFALKMIGRAHSVYTVLSSSNSIVASEVEYKPPLEATTHGGCLVCRIITRFGELLEVTANCLLLTPPSFVRL